MVYIEYLVFRNSTQSYIITVELWSVLIEYNYLFSGPEGPAHALGRSPTPSRGSPLHVLAGIQRDGAFLHLPVAASRHAGPRHLQAALLSERQAYPNCQVVRTLLTLVSACTCAVV